MKLTALLLSITFALPSAAQKGGDGGDDKGGGSSGTDGVVSSGTITSGNRGALGTQSEAYKTFVSQLATRVAAERVEVFKDNTAKEGDFVDGVATAIRTQAVTAGFSDTEVGELVALAVDESIDVMVDAQKEGGDTRGGGRTGDDSSGDSPWWPQSTNFSGDGSSGTIDPSGVGTIGTFGTDGDLEVPNHTWFIDIGGEAGSDLVFSAGAMAINDSVLRLNVLSTSLDSYTFVTVAPGQGRGRFATVTGLPVGFELVYGESSISLVRSSTITVPEVGTVVPLIAMMMPWFFARRRSRR